MKLINYGHGLLELWDEPLEVAHAVSDSEADIEPQERSKKRMRIEQHAREYLAFRPVSIQSAALRGPFPPGWVNPWSHAEKSEPAGGRSKSSLSIQESPDSPQLASETRTCNKDSRKSHNATVATLRDKETSVNKLAVSNLKRSEKISAKDRKANSRVIEQQDIAVDEHARNNDGTATLPEEASECPYEGEHSSRLHPLDKRSFHPQGQDDIDPEFEHFHVEVNTGFTPINAKTSSRTQIDANQHRRASTGTESSTRPGREFLILDKVPQSYSDKENRIASLNTLETSGSSPSPHNSVNLGPPIDRVSQKSTHEAAMRCIRSKTARKGNRFSLRASDPRQVASRHVSKPTESTSSFVFQRRGIDHVDERANQAPAAHSDTENLRQKNALEGLPVLQVPSGEDWAFVDQYTNCILPSPKADTTPSKRASNQIRSVLRASGASMQSAADITGNGAVQDSGKTSSRVFQRVSQKSTQAASPGHPLNETSFITDVSTQAAMTMVQRALQDTLISPTKSDFIQSAAVATPVVPHRRNPISTDSQRRITLSGPPISTQEILAGVSPFVFDTAQKAGHDDELSGDAAQQQFPVSPVSPVSPSRASQKGKSSRRTSQQDSSPETREESGFMSLLGESFNLSETIEDIGVYLQDSEREEKRRGTFDKEMEGH